MPADREHHAAPLGAVDTCELVVDGIRYRYLAFPEPRPARMTPLTPAEQDVAERAAAGESTKLIARARGTSVRTVDHQLARVFRKLDVGSRHELIELMFRR